MDENVDSDESDEDEDVYGDRDNGDGDENEDDDAGATWRWRIHNVRRLASQMYIYDGDDHGAMVRRNMLKVMITVTMMRLSLIHI